MTVSSPTNPNVTWTGKYQASGDGKIRVGAPGRFNPEDRITYTEYTLRSEGKVLYDDCGRAVLLDPGPGALPPTR